MVEKKEKFDQHDANELVDIGGKENLESAQQSNCVPKKMSTQIWFGKFSQYLFKVKK